MLVACATAGCGPAPTPQHAPAAASTPAPVAPAPEDKRLVYDIIFSGRVAGQVVVVRHANGAADEDLEFAERGAGPKLHARLELGEDGFPDRFELTGHNRKQRPVHELLSCDATHCRWSGTDEQGEGPRAFYVANNKSVVADAALLSLAKRRGRVPLLPSGSFHAEKLVATTLTQDGKPFVVSAYELDGFGFEPRVEWFSDDGEWFAQVDEYGAGIRQGFAAHIPKLLALQAPLDRARRERIATRVSHRPHALSIVHARLFSPRTLKVTEDATVNIVDGKVTSVGAKLPAADGAEVIDAGGKTVLPGLWDMHVHSTVDDGPMHVANGITTVRDLGSDVEAALARKASWDAGTELGPHMLLAGFVDGRGPKQGPTKMFADTPAEAERVVETYASKGYTQLKIYGSMKHELVPVLVKLAKAKGMRVSGHVPQGMTAEGVVKAGYDEIQHLEHVIFDLHSSSKESRGKTALLGERGADIGLDAPKTKALFALLQQRHIVVDPTLNVVEAELTTGPGHPNPTIAPVLSRLPPQVQRSAFDGGLPNVEKDRERYERSFARCLELTKRLWDRGVPLVAGSDAWAGFALHRELELYVKAGIPNAEVLRIATLGAARVMKLEKSTGAIEPGKVADLIIVEGDPLVDMSRLRDVVTVVKDGRVVDAVAARAALSIH